VAAPTVHPFTRELYDSLPEVYRDVDVDDGSDNGMPLLRFLSLVGDRVGAIRDLVDRIDPDVGLGSELLDPMLADPRWLPWLAQMLGVANFPPSLTIEEQRLALAGAVSGWRAGTREALVDAARSALTDPDGYVAMRPHYGGNPFVIGVSVDPEFAPPDLDDVVTAIIRAGAKPAGVQLVIDLYALAWDTLEAVFTTWGSLDAVATWNRLEGTDPA
jgi:hypothetical protein